jgi:hypothetical protein
MNKIMAAFLALEEGRSLNNVTFWKKVQLTTNALMAVIIVLPDNILIQFGNIEGIGLITLSLAVLINLYLTPATTNKIGLRSNDRE